MTVELAWRRRRREAAERAYRSAMLRAILIAGINASGRADGEQMADLVEGLGRQMRGQFSMGGRQNGR